MSSADRTLTNPPTYTTTPEESVALRFDTTELLSGDDPPTAPQSLLFRVVELGADEPVTLADAPTLDGTIVVQRIRALPANATYRLRVTFLTGGNRRAITLTIICVE